MTDIDLYVDLIKNGEVLGVGLGSSPEEWESRLGDDYLDDQRKGQWRRDYGLIEVSFQKREKKWECFGFSAQVHRLRPEKSGIVPGALERAYGRFELSPLFAELADRLDREGLHIEELGSPSMGGFVRHRARSSSFRAEVISSRGEEDGHELREILWSITIGRST
ncbi:hypothetical protein V1L54_17215 [Streptomyces sp. TRM 70361]|uniref:hypothetical protein n=1 Tax=Streptomyces sp. TRM 70361 TaxID=3116553 RepID=UPI002E7AD403|nr:hypothetical protein [Streptomyces sp. TRM 70361]MEE1941121.1 hypothetical protein [Streptomyces sp. TRM 70361]